MKKTITGLMLLASCSASADVIYGFNVGVQGWSMDTDGAYGSNGNQSGFGFDSEPQSHIYAAFEHPVPLIPNVRLARTTFDTAGDALLSNQFTLGSINYNANTNVATTLDLTSTDHILYYEVLDNDLVSIDLGFNGKQIKGTIAANDTDTGVDSFQGISGFVPMLWSKIEVGLPLTGLGIYAEGSYLAVNDSKVSDLQAAITYTLADSLLVDMIFQLGYRRATLELDDFDDIDSNLDFDGVFAGIELDF